MMAIGRHSTGHSVSIDRLTLTVVPTSISGTCQSTARSSQEKIAMGQEFSQPDPSLIFDLARRLPSVEDDVRRRVVGGV